MFLPVPNIAAVCDPYSQGAGPSPRRPHATCSANRALGAAQNEATIVGPGPVFPPVSIVGAPREWPSQVAALTPRRAKPIHRAEQSHDCANWADVSRGVEGAGGAPAVRQAGG